MLKYLSGFAITVLFGLGSLATTYLPVKACDPPARYKVVTVYEPVTCQEVQTVKYLQPVTKYDNCGHSYTEYEVRTKEVQVTVTKQVAVTKRVKVCD